jgi:hypothetical protein
VWEALFFDVVTTSDPEFSGSERRWPSGKITKAIELAGKLAGEEISNIEFCAIV